MHIRNRPLPLLVTFDWDETLADTRDCVVFALEAVLKLFGKEPWDITKKKYRDKNKSLKENFSNFFGEKADEAYSQYLEIYKENIKDKVSAMPGSYEVLAGLAKMNIRYAVISNKETELLKTEIDGLFPDAEFCCVLGNGDAGKNKPDAAPILKACETAGIKADNPAVWHVGDSKQDTDCARNAGVTAVLVGNGKFFDALPGEDIYQIEDLNALLT